MCIRDSYNSYSQTYYMSVTGSDSVFAIESSFKTKFNYTLDDLIVLESLPSGELTFKEYTVTMPDGTENLYSDENLLTLFDDLESVSYTHLDVYKRQVLFRMFKY